MSISLRYIHEIGYVDKVIIICHDQGLYLFSIIFNGVEHFVVNEKGYFH